MKILHFIKAYYYSQLHHGHARRFYFQVTMTSNQNLATWKQSTVKCFNSLYFKIADLAQNKHIIAYERMREHFRDQRGAAVIREA